jgi:uncharacterized membrane protein YdjX (TVP38/TMEM64 family)
MLPTPFHARRFKKVAGWIAAALIVVALTLPYWAPASVRPMLGPFSSPEGARAFVADQGAWAWAAYIGLWIFQAVVAPLPAFALTLAGATLFGFWGALALTTTGAMAGAAVTFAIGRRLRSAVLQQNLSADARAARIERFVRERGAWGVFALRLLPLFPFDPVSYLAGFARVPWGPFLLATLLGMMPATVALTLIGSGVLPERYKWVAIVALSLMLVAAAVVTQWVVIPRLFRQMPPRGRTG